MEESTDGIHHSGRMRGILYARWVHHSAKSTRNNLHIDVCSHDGGVAIVVDGSLLLTMDMNLSGLEGLDARIVWKRLCKHIKCDTWCLQHAERLHDNHIQKSILHRGAWSYIGIVAILGCVGTCD